VQFAVATPMQVALADFLVECAGHHLGLPAFYQAKRDHFCRILADTPLTFVPSAGTYFQLADYSAVSDLADVEFARWLTCEIGVAAIPVSVFSASAPAVRVVRFCFAKHESTLDAAGERLRRLTRS
jgi:methionine aminotransferase